jgi:hypothetical protein
VVRTFSIDWANESEVKIKANKMAKNIFLIPVKIKSSALLPKATEFPMYPCVKIVYQAQHLYQTN